MLNSSQTERSCQGERELLLTVCNTRQSACLDKSGKIKTLDELQRHIYWQHVEHVTNTNKRTNKQRGGGGGYGGGGGDHLIDLCIFIRGTVISVSNFS